jgi:RNA 2',3'-cyclic 3'-phosphodiesterase
LTLFFLGDCDLPSMVKLMQKIPDPGFRIGLAGIFDRPVFLPDIQPKTAGWHVRFLEQKTVFLDFRERLRRWLEAQGVQLCVENGEFLAHVTIARQPFEILEWKKAFQKLPLFLKNIHLCESLGRSHYEISWSHQILAPFERKEHMADLAFLIRGETYQQLFVHAALALAFHFPPFIRYLEEEEIHGMDELIFQLNRVVARADAAEGCPFKAVSYHSVMVERENMFEWEMIVDV